jgi:hypothetical protein
MSKNKIICLLLFFSGLHSIHLYGQKRAFDFDMSVKNSVSINKNDTLKWGNIKINPVKLAFNEISITYEHFRKPILTQQSHEKLTGIDSIIDKRKKEHISSTSYIIGFMYPSDINNLIEYKDQIHYTCVQYLEDAGISPFINWGLSLKLDFRRYRNNFYWGPEFMEKFVFYTKTWVDNKSGTAEEPSERLQSGYANIIGFGYFIGWQMERKRLVTDLFFGAGARYRSAIRKIWEEQFYQGGPTVLYPDPKSENLSRAYPALNFGIRLGFNL